MKQLLWLGDSKDAVRAFPPDARQSAGFQLDGIQQGAGPDDWKPMPSIGPGVREIRIRAASGAYRVIYLATRPEGVYVLHAFQKKSARTGRSDVALARERLRWIAR
jgi:phage-related protein